MMQHEADPGNDMNNDELDNKQLALNIMVLINVWSGPMYSFIY